uniref:helix-turn-helix domain-containing protein n=1 Tax=Flavobacterium sp. TaxID=239 RepID=UPI00404A7C84
MNLKEIRVSKGFTQNQMAEKMAMEQTTYSKKERGISPINENEWKRLSEIFETPIDVLKKALPQMQRLSRHEQKDMVSIPLNVFTDIVHSKHKLEKENNALKEAIQNLKKQA